MMGNSSTGKAANNGAAEPTSTGSVTNKHMDPSQIDDTTMANVLFDPQKGKAAMCSIAQQETCTIRYLRATALVLLLSTAVAACVSIFLLVYNDERRSFEVAYHSNAQRIVESFHHAITQRLSATHMMATALTSHSLSSGQEFPFVTLPHFAQRGSALRVTADSMVVHWVPLVTEENRLKWEEYALEHRWHIDEAFEQDAALREYQDEEIFPVLNETRRTLQDEEEEGNLTVLEDGTGFHPHIWNEYNEPPNSGPYFPLWQRSPINKGKQRPLNYNDAKSPASTAALKVLQETQMAVLNHATMLKPQFRERFKQNVALSQYRRNIPQLLDDPVTYLYYPVFTSFDTDNRSLAGVLETNIYWNLFFQNILQEEDSPILCVLENSFNQTLSYRILGAHVTVLGEVEPPIPPNSQPFMVETNVNAFVESQASPRNRAYLAAPLLSQDYGIYKLRIYPAHVNYNSNRPLLYTLLFAAVFAFTALVYIAYTVAVEKRRKVITQATILQAEKAANTERALNEFVAHEVRNPLSAAIFATSFIKSALTDTSNNLQDTRASLLDDVEIVVTSLHFINDFLRSIIDTHRAAAHQLQVKLAPTELLRDVLEPAQSMLYNNANLCMGGGNVELTVECDADLIVATDSLRLKQVIINLMRNSLKFVDRGFVRVRVQVSQDEEWVRIFVEDSGPGIPEDKLDRLFAKYQSSLDSLAQGTGLGLNLCKNLMVLLQGDIWLDTSYDSGVQGSPGARFVLQLNAPPLKLESLTYQHPMPLDGDSKATTKELISMEEGSVKGEEKGDKRETKGEEAAVSRLDDTIPEKLTVLFVDDDMMLRKLFTRGVKKVFPDWEIEQAASGEHSLRMVESKDYDIIFMDQYMASTEQQLLGTETVRALRAQGVPSIICGLSANDMEQAFVAAGANAFVLKPFPCRPDELKRVIFRILRASPEPPNVERLRDGTARS